MSSKKGPGDNKVSVLYPIDEGCACLLVQQPPRSILKDQLAHMHKLVCYVNVNTHMGLALPNKEEFLRVLRQIEAQATAVREAFQDEMKQAEPGSPG